jgi:hypothetical protein
MRNSSVMLFRLVFPLSPLHAQPSPSRLMSGPPALCIPVIADIEKLVGKPFQKFGGGATSGGLYGHLSGSEEAARRRE